MLNSGPQVGPGPGGTRDPGRCPGQWDPGQWDPGQWGPGQWDTPVGLCREILKAHEILKHLDIVHQASVCCKSELVIGSRQ